MTEYNCIVCNYSTQNNSNYNKHLLTNKHLDKIKNIFKCDNCDYITTNLVNYNRHLQTKKHLKHLKHSDNNKYPEEIKELLLEVKEEKEEARKTIELLMKKIDNLEKNNEQNTNKINDTNNQNTNKLVKEARLIKKSVLTLLNTHFKDTPSIEYIKKEPFFEALEEEYNAKINDGSDKLFMRIFTDYEKKKLVKTLSDLILKFVKKDDQKFQSVFNIDSARFNFATKIDDFWMNDKKGVQLRKFTIDKVVDFMIDVLDVFRLRLIKLRKENIIKSTIERSDYLMTNQKLLFEVVNYLNSPNTHIKIITQLSPNLRYDEQLLLLK